MERTAITAIKMLHDTFTLFVGIIFTILKSTRPSKHPTIHPNPPSLLAHLEAKVVREEILFLPGDWERAKWGSFEFFRPRPGIRNSCWDTSKHSLLLCAWWKDLSAKHWGVYADYIPRKYQIDVKQRNDKIPRILPHNTPFTFLSPDVEKEAIRPRHRQSEF